MPEVGGSHGKVFQRGELAEGGRAAPDVARVVAKNLLAERRFEPLRDDAREGVGDPAGCVGHDPLDRPDGILRPGARGAEDS